MGGGAFPALFTPRMKPVAYFAIREICQNKLRGIFADAAIPIEAPAKVDHGDIDVHVLSDRDSSSLEELREKAFNVLGAIKKKHEQEHLINYAMPWPENVPCEGAVLEANKPVYVQVDVHVCTSSTNLKWLVFRYAHGDMWNCLGSVIRPFGLIVNEHGLCIYTPEIEDKKKARVLLSSDPERVKQFLGLEAGREPREGPFASEQDLFEYIATCRLFWVKAKNNETSIDDKHDGSAGDSLVQPDVILGADMNKIDSSTRERIIKRPVFKRWFKEFLPGCRASGRYPSQPLTRDEVRELAFQHFPGVESTYYRNLKLWRISQQQIFLSKTVIKPALPADLEANRRACCASALTKIIMKDDTSFDGIVAPSNLKDSNGLFDEALVTAWVGEVWSKVLDVAWRINQARCAAAKELKAARKRSGSGSGSGEVKTAVKEDLADCAVN